MKKKIEYSINYDRYLKQTSVLLSKNVRVNNADTIPMLETMWSKLFYNSEEIIRRVIDLLKYASRTRLRKLNRRCGDLMNLALLCRIFPIQSPH